MKRNVENKRNVRAFTLVEMLVVIAIIGILIGLLLPAIGAAKRAILRARAKAEASSIVTAILQFKNEYGRWPMQNTAASDKFYNQNPAEYQQLIGVLRADTTNTMTTHVNQYNPRRKPFLDVKDTSMLKGDLVDPWDRPYQVVVDWNGDNKVQYMTTGGGNGQFVNAQQVVVWSQGESTTVETDNQKSWVE